VSSGGVGLRLRSNAWSPNLRFEHGVPTGVEIEGRAWVIDVVDRAVCTHYVMRPFPYDPLHRVLCACGLYVGADRRAMANPPGAFYIDQVPNQFSVDLQGNLSPCFTVAPFRWDPAHIVVCACGDFVGKPRRGDPV
jgi:hypothetical protein